MSTRLPRLLALLTALSLSPLSISRAQSQAQVERPVSFDAAGRVLTLTPSIAARWKLTPPDWPLGSDWKEARLYATDPTAISTAGAVLVVQRVDGAVARYVYPGDALLRLRGMIDAALLAQGNSGDGTRGGTSFELSEPAGNAFVRNQTFLGLLAYGPATAAILSDNGAAASTGGYLLAAGSSFFIAAKTVRDRSVSRAQTLLAFHGGTRGAIAGAAVAAIAERDGGVGYGVPILIGAVGGTVAGYRGARGMSDGEAASSGFAADLGGLTTLGVSGAVGMFEDDTATSGDLETKGKTALGAGIAVAAIGYVIGPRYARRSSYNVTAGDIDVGFTSAIIGALGVNALLSSNADPRTRFAVSTGGLLLGALAADRTKIRHGDRTSADGTLAQLGAVAGALMGGGFAVITEMNPQATIGAVAVGGMLGMVGADAIVNPARDAGPKRGVLPSDGGFASGRVSLSVVPAVTQLALGWKETTRPRRPNERVEVRRVPVLRISF